MELKDAVDVYNAKTNAEAREYMQTLLEAGIEAYVMEESSIGELPFGVAIAHPDSCKVWVDRPEAERAAEIINRFDKARAEAKAEQAASHPEQAFVTAICEECGQSSMFAGAMLGSVQECPHCGKFMDVAASGDDLEWGDPEDEEPTHPEP